MKLPFILFFLITILAILQIFFANQEANTGKILQKIEEEIAWLEGENKVLETEIASQGSLENLREKAEKLGFNQEQTVINLLNQKEVAVNF